MKLKYLVLSLLSMLGFTAFVSEKTGADILKSKIDVERKPFAEFTQGTQDWSKK